MSKAKWLLDKLLGTAVSETAKWGAKKWGTTTLLAVSGSGLGWVATHWRSIDWIWKTATISGSICFLAIAVLVCSHVYRKLRLKIGEDEEVAKLKALVEEKQSGCVRRDDMIAERDYALLRICLDQSERIQKEYLTHELQSSYKPLHSSSYLDSNLPWGYKMRRMGSLKEQVSYLATDAKQVWQALGLSEQPTFFDSAKTESITVAELLRSMVKFSSFLEAKLGVLAHQLHRT
jgi:hypothetical protein